MVICVCPFLFLLPFPFLLSFSFSFPFPLFIYHLFIYHLFIYPLFIYFLYLLVAEKAKEFDRWCHVRPGSEPERIECYTYFHGLRLANLEHCARHGVTAALVEVVILAPDFEAEPVTDGIRAIGFGTVNGRRYRARG